MEFRRNLDLLVWVLKIGAVVASIPADSAAFVGSA